MQRVSAFLPSWDKRHSGSGKTAGLFGWAHNSSSSRSSSSHASRTPASINVAAANAHRVQREAFWPASLDVECDKAARILKSFCADGYYAPVDAEPSPSSSSPPQTPAKMPNKIPKRIVQNAAGIAVFTCMRSGLWMTGSGGSGILIARKSDGTWSPPSGILLHTPTLSFIIGVDIYDCVLVINNLAALESITRPRVTLGEDVGLTNGPSVPLHSDEGHISCRELGNTVLAYMKARGQHQAVNLHGCILTERANENERFYDADVTQMDILAGNVARHVQETKPLFEVIKMAEGRTDYDAAVINKTAILPAPGDAMIATPKSTPTSAPPSFGIPKADDPDPYGVLALEMAGLEIREAGARLRPTSSQQFECGSSPLSPSLSKFSRQSVETFATRSNRASVMSCRTVRSQVTDAYTQTDVANTPETTPSPGQSDDGQGRASIDRMPDVKEHAEVDYTRIDLAPLRHLSQDHSIGAVLAAGTVEQRNMPTLAPSRPDDDAVDKATTASSIYEGDHDQEEEPNDADDEDDLDDGDEEPVVLELAAVQPASTRAVASRVIQARGNVVTIAKRPPPPLPKRSPARDSRSGRSDIGGEMATVRSPLRQTFSDAELTADEDREPTVPTETKVDAPGTPSRHVDETGAVDGDADGAVAREAKAGADGAVAREAKAEAAHNGEAAREDSNIEATAPVNAEAQGVLIKGVDAKDLNIEAPATVDAQTKTPLTEDALSDEGSEKEAEFPEAEVEVGEPNSGERGTEEDETKLDTGTGYQRREAETTKAAVGERGNGEDATVKECLLEQTDNSDSTTHEKHTSSSYTGASEDRCSCDGSSLTTPVSDTERRDSLAEKTTKEEDGPTSMTKTVEEARAPQVQQPRGVTAA